MSRAIAIQWMPEDDTSTIVQLLRDFNAHGLSDGLMLFNFSGQALGSADVEGLQY